MHMQGKIVMSKLRWSFFLIVVSLLLSCSENIVEDSNNEATVNERTNYTTRIHTDNAYRALVEEGHGFVSNLTEREIYLIATSLTKEQIVSLPHDLQVSLEKTVTYVKSNYVFDEQGLPLPLEPISRNSGIVIMRDGEEISIHDYLKDFAIEDIAQMDREWKLMFLEHMTENDLELLTNEQKSALESF